MKSQPTQYSSRVRRPKHLRFLPVGLIYANFILGALKHLLLQGLGALDIYIRPWGLIYANFILGLGALNI